MLNLFNSISIPNFFITNDFILKQEDFAFFLKNLSKILYEKYPETLWKNIEILAKIHLMAFW